MPQYLQKNRPLAVATPLGTDALVLSSFSGIEGLSQLFHFHLDLLAENTQDVAFDKLLGQKITITVIIADGKKRFLSGICNRVSQGEQDSTFTNYRMEMVPAIWLLTRRTQSRIFQHMSVPDILKKVLEGFEVTWEIQGTFQPRDYCVQYRESDFAFASRLMEEEGIFYFFEHSEGGHKLIVANTASSHRAMPILDKIIFETIGGGNREEHRIFSWEKTQELRSGKVTLWDHTFELPHKHLEAEKLIQESVDVGKVSHKMKVANNDKLEIYDYPGGYAQRFDGSDRGGGDRPADIQKVFEDNKRTTALRMEEIAAGGLVIHGVGNCRQFTSGFKFSLTRHFNADGAYLVTSVKHTARTMDFRSSESEEFQYHNNFTCIPLAIPFRPTRTTPRPVVDGSQTAVVVGPAGEEIFCDKYGRVKVQFHWDRQGKNNADSSCWVRVGTPWAGKQWGMVHIPRIGQEVVVDFMEGDPDQPIVTGSVYNADQMPPYALPANKTQSGIVTRSTLTGDPETFNEICFEDKKGSELLYIRAEKDQHIAVENDENHWVGKDRVKEVDHNETVVIGNDRNEHVKNNETILIDANRKEEVKKSETIKIGTTRTESVGGNESIGIGGNRTESVEGNEKVTVAGNRDVNVQKNEALVIKGNQAVAVEGDSSLTSQKNVSTTSKKNMNLSADGKMGQKSKEAFVIQSEDQITIQCGEAKIVMKKNGDITIEGGKINMKGSGKITVKGSETAVN